MEISGSVALVTGTNRGIGRAFVKELQERGASRIYATARQPQLIEIPGVEKLALDITDPDAVARAADAAGDVSLLINNAGVSSAGGLISGDMATIRGDVETNLFGTLSMVRAFAPVLAANGGGAILNTLSALAWMAFPVAGAYCISKAAALSLTDVIRLELAGQGTLVTALLMGPVDTDMMAGTGYDGPMAAPDDIARLALDGIAGGETEVLADDHTRAAKASLTSSPLERYPMLNG